MKEADEIDSIETALRLLDIEIRKTHQGGIAKYHYYGYISTSKDIAQFRLEGTKQLDFHVSLINQGKVLSGSEYEKKKQKLGIDDFDVKIIERLLELKNRMVTVVHCRDKLDWIERT